jgi:hypothetical protein
MLTERTENRARTRRTAQAAGRAAGRRVRGAQVGRIVAVAPDGAFLVDYPATMTGAQPALLAASAPSAASEEVIGRHVVLLFEDGRPERPIIVGWVAPGSSERAAAPPHRDIRVDGRRIVLAGDEEIQLRCGKASLTLTADGKVVVAGVNVVSHARATNRIRGAAVRVN